MTTIHCYDVEGNEVTIAPDAVAFRPAVYGILIENEQVLLVPHPTTKLWRPPGSILENHETPNQALKRHFRQETGLTPLTGPLIFVEDQYRVDEDGQTWHLSVLYYALDRPLYADTTLADMDTFAACWVPLADLTRKNMQFGYEAIQAGQLRLKL